MEFIFPQTISFISRSTCHFFPDFIPQQLYLFSHCQSDDLVKKASQERTRYHSEAFNYRQTTDESAELHLTLTVGCTSFITQLQVELYNCIQVTGLSKIFLPRTNHKSQNSWLYGKCTQH